ncbi:hypothetical protein GF337_05370 [candidate division KSB1 bacterium]|nr:hypothetical protein [candidate division KSB1 bacterium]
MKIQLSALKEGMNEITFEHTAETLGIGEEEEFSGIFINAIDVNIDANKIGNQLFLDVVVKTIGNFVCDRCLDDFETEMKERFRLAYSLDNDVNVEKEEDGGIRFLTKDSTVIDITDDIRESLLLVVPMKKLCTEECKGICPQCGVNRNAEECNHTDEKIDPRWEALKKLYNSTDN